MTETDLLLQKKKQILVVVGGGAAGFFCAVNAARLSPGLQIIIVEKSNKLLAKVRISGGGRCNVTHACFDIGEMSKKYPRGQNFVKKTFHQFFTTDTIQWFEDRGVTIKKEKDGRMFPSSNTSQSIIDCLVNEANLYGVEVMMHADVKSIEYSENKFQLHLSDSRAILAHYVCIASGGYPKASLFEWVLKTGHTVSEPVPSLFTFNLTSGQEGLQKHPINELMGVSVEKVRVKIEGTKLVEEGPLLITHWGFSGPAILKLSAWGARELAIKKYEFNVHINWLPDYNEQSLKEQFQFFRTDQRNKKVANYNFTNLPNRLWNFLLKHSGVNEEIRFADLPVKVENVFIKNLVDFTAEVRGKTTYKEEFVTAGGIHLSEIDANTMMSKKTPNLFFAGEVLDVDGITGGFNFQHAWTTGWIAAKTISRLSNEHNKKASAA